MITNKVLVQVLSILLAISSTASAFFGWGSSEQTSPASPVHYYYHKRLLQGPMPAYAVLNEQRHVSSRRPGEIPSVPIQVPLPAQLSPVSTVQNVQLVPCLCPVSQDYSYENQSPPQEFFYSNRNGPVQPVQQPQFQQQQQVP